MVSAFPSRQREEAESAGTLHGLAAVVRADAYGCGIGPIAGALAKSGCNTFFVSNLPEAKSVRAVAPQATIYVLNGFYSGTGPAFAEINARPVINSTIELAIHAMSGSSKTSTRCAGSFAASRPRLLTRPAFSLIRRRISIWCARAARFTASIRRRAPPIRCCRWSS